MAVTNANLQKAKNTQDDEFYTRMEDIVEEVSLYRECFQGKKVFLNCDNPEWSNFWLFFQERFDSWGLERLMSSHYDPNGDSYRLDIVRGVDLNGDGRYNEHDIVRTPLDGAGDFASPECMAILQECDIVVTNPPFSKFRIFMSMLIDSGKDFLVLGPQMGPGYACIFPLVANGTIRVEHPKISNSMKFIRPSDGDSQGVPCWWFTTLLPERHREPMKLKATYGPLKHRKCDNYDIVNVDFIRNIPCDYYDLMCVPVTILGKFSPEQFRIVGIMGDLKCPEIRARRTKMPSEYPKKLRGKANQGIIKKKRKYKNLFKRIVIQRVDLPQEVDDDE